MLFSILSILAIAGLIALIPFSSYADRLIGHGAQGRTKPVLLTVAAFGLVGFGIFVHWLPAVLFGLLFAIWRTPGFGPNVITPTNDEERARTFRRHFLFSAIPAAIVLFVGGAPLAYLLVPFAVFALFAKEVVKIATEAAKVLVDGIDRNAEAEKKRGKLYGIAIAAVFVPFLVLGALTPVVNHNKPAEIVQVIKNVTTAPK